MNTAHHYTVKHTRATRPEIALLICRHCSYSLDPRRFRRPGDRSGLPRYNRARAEMVRHLHDQHRDDLGAGGEP